jgi:hypothetical protein
MALRSPVDGMEPQKAAEGPRKLQTAAADARRFTQIIPCAIKSRRA